MRVERKNARATTARCAAATWIERVYKALGVPRRIINSGRHGSYAETEASAKQEAILARRRRDAEERKERL